MKWSKVVRDGRILLSSGGPWEAKVGYSRAIRVGNAIYVAGTTSPGETVEEQFRGAMKVIFEAIEQLGAKPEHIVRTVMFVTNVEEAEPALTRLHREYFGETGIMPAATMVQVSGFIDPKLKVEIQVEAIANSKM